MLTVIGNGEFNNMTIVMYTTAYLIISTLYAIAIGKCIAFGMGEPVECPAF